MARRKAGHLGVAPRQLRCIVFEENEIRLMLGQPEAYVFPVRASRRFLTEFDGEQASSPSVAGGNSGKH